MKSLGERELPNVKNKGGGNKFSEGLYFLMDVDVRYGKQCYTNLAVFLTLIKMHLTPTPLLLALYGGIC